MEIRQKKINAQGIKLYIEEDGKEIGRAYLYLLSNGLHEDFFGFMEDVYIDENHRGRGLGTELVKKLVALAKEKGCYKLIATSRHSRPKVHLMYEKLGFKNQGVEFRVDF